MKRLTKTVCGTPVRDFFFLLFLAACASSGTDGTPSSDGVASVPGAGEDGGAPLSCSLTIRCDTLLEHLPELAEGNGARPGGRAAPFRGGGFIFGRRERVRRVKAGVAVPANASGVFGKAPPRILRGICNLYEYDCGELSGWLYRINGETPGYSCSEYPLSDGDVLEFLYTCDLGDDL